MCPIPEVTYLSPDEIFASLPEESRGDERARPSREDVNRLANSMAARALEGFSKKLGEELEKAKRKEARKAQ